MESEIDKSDKGLKELICYCCGEKYSLKNFSKEDPLEVCGECGAEYFIPYSENYLKGYTCLEEYSLLVNLLSERLRPAFPSRLYHQLSPFRI